MALRSVDQIGMDETVIEDPELEELLETREKRKASASAVSAEYRAAHNAALVEIEKRDELVEGNPIRIGRFRLTRSKTAARAVSFETEPKDRVSIALLDDE
jgi:hypothetical protein